MASEGCDMKMILIGFLAILLFYVIYTQYNGSYNDEEFKLTPFGTTELICSKNCCATEWDTGLVVNDGVDKNKYNATNINCNDGVRSTGCICMPK